MNLIFYEIAWAHNYIVIYVVRCKNFVQVVSCHFSLDSFRQIKGASVQRHTQKLFLLISTHREIPLIAAVAAVIGW